MDNDSRSSWELRDIHIREVLAIELRHRDKALEVQAREYERRLNTLNHENERILQAAALAVSNEKFDGFIKQLNDWQKIVDRFVAQTETTTSNLEKAQIKLRAMVMIWLAAATILLGVSRIWMT